MFSSLFYIFLKIVYVYLVIGASLMAQTVKNLPARQETQVWSLVRKIHWRREWLPTWVFLPGESHGWRSLVGYSLQGCKESDMTERLHFHSVYKINKQGDNIQSWLTPFPIWNQSVVPCPILTAASWSAYKFLRRQVRWSGIPIPLRIFHSLLWYTQSKALA